MNNTSPPSQIQSDGLRYKNKTTGSPYGPGIGLSLSCIKCGQHRPRSLLSVMRLAGAVHYKCTGGCNAGASVAPADAERKDPGLG